MNCAECGKPNAKRDHVREFRGRRHWIAYCSIECKREHTKRHVEYVKTENERNPFNRKR